MNWHFWHRWSNWTDAFHGREFTRFDNRENPKAGYPVTIQERRCSVCNKLEQRTLRTMS